MSINFLCIAPLQKYNQHNIIAVHSSIIVFISDISFNSSQNKYLTLKLLKIFPTTSYMFKSAVKVLQKCAKFAQKLV